MIYGKVECRVESDNGSVRLTVHGGTCTIKQNDDLIRLSRADLRELAADIVSSLDELEAGKAE